MSLTVITGAKKSGKTGYIIELLKKNPRDAYFLVPEKNLLYYEKAILENLGEGSAFLAETLSFRKLSLKLLEYSDKFGAVRLLDNETRNMLLSSVILKNRSKLRLFRAGGKSDYSQMVASQITEFKRHLITGEMIFALIEDSSTPPSLRDKLYDINVIYPEYEKALSNTFADGGDLITVAAKTAGETGFFTGKRIYIDGFTGFTAQELLMISSMLSCEAEVFITVDYEEKYGRLVGDLYYSVGKTVRKLMRLCSPVKVIECKKDNKTGGEREHIINNYMTAKEKYTKKTEKVYTDVYPSYQAEANAAASLIAEKISEGAKPEDFLVVAADFETTLHSLGKYLDGFDIPYYGDIKKSVAELPVFVVAESVTGIILNVNNINAALDYLKSVCVSGDNREDGHVFENFLRSSGVRGYTLFGDGGFEKLKASAYNFDDSAEPQIKNIYDKFILPVVKLRKSIKKGTTASDYAAALYGFFKEIGLEEIITAIAEEYEKDGNGVQGIQYVQVYNAIVEILEKSCLIFGENEITFREFKNILNDNLSEKTIAGVPLGCSSVLITGFHSIPADTFPYVILMNANDGILLPSSHEGFINEDDRKYMLSKGIELSLTPAEKTTEEYLKIFTVLTAFENELYISSSRFDRDGGEMTEADAIGYLKDILPEISPRSTGEKVYTKQSLLDEAVSELYGSDPDTGADKLKFLYGIKEYRSEAESVIQKIGVPPKTDISVNGISKMLPDILPMSITSYEKYRSCGFSYFIKYILKGKEQDVYSIDTAGIGSLSHMVLQRFSEKVKRDGMSFSQIDEGYITKTIGPITERVVREVNNGIFMSSKRASFTAKKVKRSVKRTLLMIREHFVRGEFGEYGFEMTFGRPDAVLPGLEITLDKNRKIILTGTIDRVDTLKEGDNEYIRIVDYKSRQKTLDLYEIYYGINIQLITYLMVMLKSKISKNLLPGGVLYLSMDDPLISVKSDVDGQTLEAEIRKNLVMRGLFLKDDRIIDAMDNEIFKLGFSDIIDVKLDKNRLLDSKNTLSVKEFELLFEKTADNIRKEAEKIYNGKFDIRPVKNGNKTSCGYCPYSPICCFDGSLCGSEEIAREKAEDILGKMKEEAGEG